MYVCTYSPMYKRRNSVRPRTLGISQLNNIKLAICLGMLGKTRINRFHEQFKNSSLILSRAIDTYIYIADFVDLIESRVRMTNRFDRELYNLC